MLDKPLDHITVADLQELIEEKWLEVKVVDYKRGMYRRTDSDKKELLKDVSSFANTDGGDLIIGVDEAGGAPTAIPGVAITDVDAEKLRLDRIIRQDIEPRIDFAIHTVDTGSGTVVFVIRVRERWILPHRVVYQKFGEFFARNSAGAYSMDMTELGRAFKPKSSPPTSDARFSPGRYITPRLHIHQWRGEDGWHDGWHNDTSYHLAHRLGHPPLFVADPRRTFLWDEPMIYFAGGHCRNYLKWSSLRELSAKLRGSGP